MTMEMVANNRTIIRLEHIFQGDDDDNLAQPLQIDLDVGSDWLNTQSLKCDHAMICNIIFDIYLGPARPANYFHEKLCSFESSFRMGQPGIASLEWFHPGHSGFHTRNPEWTQSPYFFIDKLARLDM